MPRLVATVRTFAAVLALVGVLAVGCTNDGDGGSQTPASSRSSSPTESTPVARAGEYSYSNAGLDATVKFGTSGATLTLKNGTGRTIEKPGLYVEDATTGKEIDGKVAAASAIPDGKTGAFKVAFPSTVRPETIGLLILLIGPDNYGAFVPPAAG
jgi:hypothetical protein